MEDIAYRVNYISVISSAATAMFSYLLTVRLVGFFFNGEKEAPLNRLIAYVGGFAGGLFVAFSRTNWSNSVEAEVYGLALALTVMIVWLTVKYFEDRGTARASRDMILVFYLALLGVGLHMTVFIVVPVVAIFFIIKQDATPRDWAMVCGFILTELLLIFLLAGTDVDINERSRLFYLLTGVLGVVLAGMLFRKINWALLVAIASACTVMIGFELYLYVTPITLLLALGCFLSGISQTYKNGNLSILIAVIFSAAIGLFFYKFIESSFILTGLLFLFCTGTIFGIGKFSQKYRFTGHLRNAIAIIFVAALGMSVHLYIPIRSTLKPRIDENGPARGWPTDWTTFINFLDRKQYGQTSMVDRMFDRRGKWENQFGRHANMGFWSYFEEQYSTGG
ncbi:MAG: glycosyltransferase family 117 protein, partial [Candidatus Zixiibacteriota bacterium]